jgi:hypothetical protein
MIQAWAPLTFMDEVGTDAARERDPVAPAERSLAVLDKATSRRLPDGTPAMSFTRLLAHMATIVRNTMRPPAQGPARLRSRSPRGRTPSSNKPSTCWPQSPCSQTEPRRFNSAY